MSGSGAVEAVLRDHRGEAIACMACTRENVSCAATVEALALLRALELCNNLAALR